MSISPEHPDPNCPACKGEGRVPFGMDEDHPEEFDASSVAFLINQRPCARCKRREYERMCPVSKAFVTLTPGHPCEDCGAVDAPDHARGPRCPGCGLEGGPCGSGCPTETARQRAAYVAGLEQQVATLRAELARVELGASDPARAELRGAARRALGTSLRAGDRTEQEQQELVAPIAAYIASLKSGTCELTLGARARLTADAVNLLLEALGVAALAIDAAANYRADGHFPACDAAAGQPPCDCGHDESVRALALARPLLAALAPKAGA